MLEARPIKGWNGGEDIVVGVEILRSSAKNLANDTPALQKFGSLFVVGIEPYVDSQPHLAKRDKQRRCKNNISDSRCKMHEDGFIFVWRGLFQASHPPFVAIQQNRPK